MPKIEQCETCGKLIVVAIFKGSGFCCDNCRKRAGKDIL